MTAFVYDTSAVSTHDSAREIGTQEFRSCAGTLNLLTTDLASNGVNVLLQPIYDLAQPFIYCLM